MELLSVESFEEKTKKGISVIDFYADWCGPCKMVTPILEALEHEMSDVSFYKVNVDEQQELALKYNIMSIPTILLFKNGELFRQTQGFSPKPLLEEFIKSAQ